MSRSPEQEREFKEWIAEAKSVDVADFAKQRATKLWKTGEGYEGPCPACGGNDRFSVNVRKQIFNCRGAEGDDVIGMVQHLDGCSFTEACEILTGRPPPNGQSTPLTEQEKAEREAKRREREQARAEAEAQEQARKSRDRDSAERQFERAKPVAATLAAAYLAARGLTVVSRWTFDLRFAPELAYWGFEDEQAQELVHLGDFPAMLAAIRAADGTMIGLHRTYLDPNEARKLLPPGDTRRNKPKKILGETTGGLIRLSKIMPVMAIGEGIETSQSWYALGRGPDDVGVAAAVSLSNMAGHAKRMKPHPRVAGKRIPDNLQPDLTRPGMILPAGVEEVILLMDGDSDEAFTAAHMALAARQLQAQGKRTSIDEAPRGKDFNDVLQEEADAA